MPDPNQIFTCQNAHGCIETMAARAFLVRMMRGTFAANSHVMGRSSSGKSMNFVKEDGISVKPAVFPSDSLSVFNRGLPTASVYEFQHRVRTDGGRIVSFSFQLRPENEEQLSWSTADSRSQLMQYRTFGDVVVVLRMLDAMTTMIVLSLLGRLESARYLSLGCS